MDTVLEVRNLDFGFEGRNILQGINFHLRRKEIYVLLGGSESGKSVFLRLVAGIFTPQKGFVEIEGVDLATASRKVLQEIRANMGFVFQEPALISNMSIYDNVALPLRYHTRLGETEIRRQVEEKMGMFGVDRRYDRSIPAQLSLGMQKRAALARALVREPKLLFLDEPATGLGAEMERWVARMLKNYQERAGASLLVVTSEWPSVLEIAHRIGLLENGRMGAEGTAQEMRVELKKTIPMESSFP